MFTTVSHLHHHQPPPKEEEKNTTPMFSYKECLKNHAATLGGHALDGCGEFMPTTTSSLKCAACGCHRNFHRRHGPNHHDSSITVVPFLRRLQPSLQQSQTRTATHSPSLSISPSPSPSPSPPQSVVSPIPYSSNYSSPPQMLLSLNTTHHTPSDHHQAMNPTGEQNPNARSRKSRTKFSSEQKLKMREFANKVGWKIHKCNENVLQDFCSEIRVSRDVLKVWMHNNKYSFGKKSDMGALFSLNNNNNNNGSIDSGHGRVSLCSNGSSSSS